MAGDDPEVRSFSGTDNYAEFVGEMSFSAYKDLGFDQVLLVEGPTDVLTFQQYLRLYGHDRKVVVIPLGGNAMVRGGREAELSELQRIARDTAIADSERTQAGGQPFNNG